MNEATKPGKMNGWRREVGIIFCVNKPTTLQHLVVVASSPGDNDNSDAT